LNASEPNGTVPSQNEAGQLTKAEQQISQLRENPRDLVRRLASFVSFELSRRASLGQLSPEDVQRDEVVDAAFAATLARLEEGNPVRDLSTFLRSRAQDIIRREVRRVANERQKFVSLDQVLAGGDESEDGLAVTLADVLPDTQARELDLSAIDREVLTYLIEALAELPDRTRTIFLQRTVQGRSAGQIADLEGLDIDEVRRTIVTARDFLRDRMETSYGVLDPDDL
jgi:RNA polymerase sigma factor (sigma-70 family)